STDGNITTWQWTFPGGDPGSSTNQNQKVCYYAPGEYGGSLIVTTNYGCKDTITITPLVTIYPWPEAEFYVSPTQAIITDPVFAFGDLWSSDVVQWEWDFGDGSPKDITSTDPIHSYASTCCKTNDFYRYNVCMRVQTQYGCWDTTCHLIEIIPEFTFYIPNTFTPNDDGVNEVFYGKGRGIKEYKIWVFDRWGNLLWDCNFEGKNTKWDIAGVEGMPSACKWDGKVEKDAGKADLNSASGELVQEDTYVWKVKLLDIFDKKHTYIGHVNVVR
ncbi:MAG: PKD domain-containing protein, partial [Bacteroidota bacterium]